MDKISIIVPCYNEREAVPIFYDAVSELNIPETEFEYIFVNDGSHDNTLDIIKSLAE